MKKSLICGSLLGALAAPAVAVAQETPETWLLMGSASGAGAVSERHNESYELGAAAGLGLYRSILPQLALGARVDAGVLPENDVDPATSFEDSSLGLGSLNAAVRVRPLARMRDRERGTGLYLEGAGGPGIVEDEIRPFIAPGAGWIFAIGEVGVGPTARYMHAFEPDDGIGENDVAVASVGLELVFLDKRQPRYKTPELEQPIPAPGGVLEPAARFEPEGRIDGDTDQDGLKDSIDRCVTVAETANGVDDHDGCPDGGSVRLAGNRVVIDERTFFGFDEAELRDEGKRKLDELVALHRSSGETWKKLRVMGHTDVRGPMPYNEELSRRRARAVAAYLTARGIPPEMIDIEAYGETLPALPNADTEREHQQNRRVEFVVDR